jgi:hypothetical protein
MIYVTFVFNATWKKSLVLTNVLNFNILGEHIFFKLVSTSASARFASDDRKCRIWQEQQTLVASWIHKNAMPLQEHLCTVHGVFLIAR